MGLLGHLATGLKGLGTGLQGANEAEAKDEQQQFTNQINQQKANATSLRDALSQISRLRTAERLENSATETRAHQKTTEERLAEQLRLAEKREERYEEGDERTQTGAVPGITAAEDRVLSSIGPRMFANSGEPFGKLSREDAESAVREAFPNMADSEIFGAAAVVIDNFNKSRQHARKLLSDVVEGMTGKDFRSPEATMSVLDARLATLPYYIPEEISEKIIAGVAAAANAPKIGAAARSRFARLTSVRSGLRQVTERIRSNPELFSFAQSRVNAIKGAFSRRLLPEDVVQTMTQLGFSREILLRAFTGAAAPETEYQRFMTDFIGGMTDGAGTLGTQLTTLDQSLHNEQQAILKASMPVPEVTAALNDAEKDQDAETNAIADKILKYLTEDEEGVSDASGN